MIVVAVKFVGVVIVICVIIVFHGVQDHGSNVVQTLNIAQTVGNRLLQTMQQSRLSSTRLGAARSSSSFSCVTVAEAIRRGC